MILVEYALEKSMKNLVMVLRLQNLVSSYFDVCAKIVTRKINNCGANQLLGAGGCNVYRLRLIKNT